jgi:hypothetical protein
MNGAARAPTDKDSSAGQRGSLTEVPHLPKANYIWSWRRLVDVDVIRNLV